MKSPDWLNTALPPPPREPHDWALLALIAGMIVLIFFAMKPEDQNTSKDVLVVLPVKGEAQ